MSGRNIRLSRIHPTTGFLAVEGAIETDGRFGIGSDNPQANLHVEGNAYVTSDLDVHGDVDIKGNFKRNGVELEILFGATPWANLQDDSNIYYTSGKVSIGAITPDATLHVEGDTYVSSNLEVGQANLFVDTTSSRVGVGTATPQAIFHVEGNTYMSSNLEVGQANLFVDTQTSRVGVGTTEPDATLHVEGNVYVSSNLEVGQANLFVDTQTSRVGVGTTEPTAILHVEGNAYVSSNLEVGQANLFVDTQTSKIGLGTTEPDATLHVEGNAYVSLNLEVGQANLFVDTTSSMVGVGTKEPDATLHVDGNAYVSSNLEVGQANLFVDTQTSRVGVGTTEPAAFLHVEGNTHVSSNLEVGQANLFVDTQTSMIGVRTNVPSFNLDVNGDINFTGAFYQNGVLFTSVIGATPWSNLQDDSNIYYTGGKVSIGSITPDATLHVEGNTYVSSNLEVGQANLFVDTTSSRVGVGTATPQANLHVVGNAYVSSNFEVGQANLFVDTQTSRVGVGTTEPDATLHVDGNTYVSSNLEVGQANLFVDTTSSKIGVRTTEPDATLHVEGNAYVSSNLEVGQANLFVDTQISRVGVGTATPQADFHVEGNAYVSSNLEVASNLTVSNINFTGTLNQNGVEFESSPWDTSGNDLTYTTGNVAIGTTSTAQKLNVGGSLRLTDGTLNTDMSVTLSSTLFEQQKIRASDKQPNDYFGRSISISGDGNTAIVGSPHEYDVNITPSPGAAYIFTHSGSSWSEQEKLEASDQDQSDQFGYSVSISGDGNTAIVGAYAEGTGGSFAGAAYIFTRSELGVWSEQQKIQASDKQQGDQFGRSVSISGDGNTAIVGTLAEGTGGSFAGAAYIFTRSGSSWSEQEKIQASDKQQGDYFGHSVSISEYGNTVIVGATGEDGPAFADADAGAAYIFTRSGSSWSEQEKLEASDRQGGLEFGRSVSISGDGNTAIVGTLASAYIFTRSVSTSTWSEQQEIQSSDFSSGDQFGTSVSISGDGNTAIVGAYAEGTGGSFAGAAYIFTRSVSTWSEQQKIQASDKQQGDYFGRSVSISEYGNTVIVGAYGEDTGTPANAGAAYISSKQACLDVTTKIIAEGSILSFTGQHLCFPEGPIERGLVVSANRNKFMNLNGPLSTGLSAIKSSESLPIISLSNVVNDPTVFGVVDGVELLTRERQDKYGGYVVRSDKEYGDNRAIINSLGEGAIWVVNTNGSILSGDYITTSNISGYGQKQDDDILHSYTVAKITMDCDFNPNDLPIQVIKKDENGNNVLDKYGRLQWEDTDRTQKAYSIRHLTVDGVGTDEANAVWTAAYVGCTYHCG
jgi:hypothetical protein